jgi:hypothetical protein
LNLDVDADPRLNGCPVVLEDGTLIGMALAPNGFARKMQCVPVDILVPAKSCYESVAPTPCINVRGGSAFHRDYGEFVGGPEVFREYDVRAEMGKDTVLRTRKGGTFIVRGTKGHGRFPPLRYEPAVELGQFMFSVGLSGSVECVSELLTEPQRRLASDLVSSYYQNRILVGLGDAEISDFASLLRACRDVHTTVRWADGRVEDILPSKSGSEYGRPLPGSGFLWFSAPEAPSQEENVAEDEEGEDTRSCIDPCEGF